LPRGCLSDVEALLTTNKIELRLEDARSVGQRMNATFNGVLRPDQQEAVEAITKHDFGMLIAPTAFGKTVTAAAVIAKRKC
jgi:superfamily II DNA or RNA helicase